MNKLTMSLLAGAALASVSIASAATATGFYVGGNVGGGNTNAKSTLQNKSSVNGAAGVNYQGTAATYGLAWSAPNFSATPSNENQTPYVPPAYNETQKFGATNPLFGVFFGYGKQVDKGYVGLEFDVGYDALNTQISSPNQNTVGGTGYVIYDNSASASISSGAQTFGKWNTKLTRAFNYGAAFRGGFFATPNTLIFVRFGLNFGKWKATLDGSNLTPTHISSTALNANTSGNTVADTGTVAGQYVLTTGTTVPSQIQKFSSSKVSFVVGLGAEIFTSANMFVRMEWNMLFGPNLKTAYDNTASFDQFGTYSSGSIKINQSQFKLGIGHKF